MLVLFIIPVLIAQARYASMNTNQAPVASFIYSPSVPAPGQTITFNASSSYAPDGTIVQYKWDLGDGAVAVLTDPIITHEYPIDGNYTVELTVTDNSGAIGSAVAIVQVQTVVFFRVCLPGTWIPVPNVEVTCYYYNGVAWVKAPASNNGFEIKYDLMTQPNLATTDAQRDRNPGYTAYILRHDASNIGFDLHPSCWKVFFKFKLGNIVTYWPNETTTVYSYNHGVVETHDYLPGHGAYWDSTAGTYVINVNDIPGHGVSPSESHPIIVCTAAQPPGFYLTVRTDPAGITTISGAGPYTSGTNVNLTAPGYVNISSTTRYRFSYWDVDGTPRGVGVNPITIQMTSNHTATAHYSLQYYLTVYSAYGSPTPSTDWFDSGTYITASVASTVPGLTGTQYVCTGWSGTGSVPSSGSGSSVAFTITAPSSITWNWKTQYRVIFDQTGVGSDFTGAVVTIDGVNYTGSQLPTTPPFWWDYSSSHTFSFASPLTVNGGKQYLWSSTSGLSSLRSGSLNVTVSGNVIGNYIVQNRITFDQTGVGSDFTGAVVTIDGTNYTRSQLPVLFSWNLNTVHTFAFQSPLIVNAGEKYVWTSTTGLSNVQSGSINITTYGSIIGNYKTQYYLTVSSPYGTIGGQGWYDSDTSAYATVTPLTVPGASGTQYVFYHWNGDATGSTSPSNAIAMNGPKTATAVWKTQYYLTVSSPYDPPTVSGWFDSGTLINASVISPFPGPAGTQYVCTGWTGTGSVPSSGSGASVSFTITAPSSITWAWKTQYYLTLATNPSGVNSPSGAGWYDAGTNATINTTAFVDIVPGSSRYRFNGWTTANMTEISNSLLSPTKVRMDKAKTVTAYYVTQYWVTFGQSGVGAGFTGNVTMIDISGYTVGTLPHSFWWDSGSSHDFVFSSSLEVTFHAKRYVWANTTGSSSQGTGTITVTASGIVTGNYKTQYYLTITSAYNSPTPTSGYVDAGPVIAAVMPWVTGPTGTRYVCTGWTGTGSAPSSGSSSFVNFIINAPSSITWNWKTQYLLTALTEPSGLSPQPLMNLTGEANSQNSWWYDASTSVTLTAEQVPGYTFKFWDLDGSPQGNSTNPITVSMNGPHTATAHYQAPPGYPVGGYSFILTEPAQVGPLAGYAMILAIFGAVITLIKRKRK